jgi:SAM-dependent methyltransferase
MAHDHDAHHLQHFEQLLDLDAEVLHDYYRELFQWVGALAPANPLIVDIGAGTGTGSLALAQSRPDATVIAVDVSESMLEHLRHQAQARGLADRVRAVQADLDEPWPDLGPADLLWASASLHHMADPGRALAQAYGTLRPGGRFVVSELDSFPRFLPGAEEAAIEDQGHVVMDELRTEAGMHMDEDWAARLAEAGFTVEDERHVDIALQPPLPAAAGRYAQISLERMRERLADRLSPADLSTLDDIVAGLPHRDDLIVRTARTVWVALRPQ